MTDLITPTKDQIRYRQARQSFWLMTIISICLLFSYSHEAEQHRGSIKDITGMQKDNDTLRLILKQQKDQIDHLQQEVDYFSKKRIDDRAKAEGVARSAFIHEEVTCLADNIYREAAYEPEDGQLAVATVTMNRVADPYYPKTICGVVYERHIKKDSDKIVCMFSWTCKPKVAVHPSIYRSIMQLARAVYFKKERSGEVGDALLYHAVYIKYPNWADQNNLVATIGQHMFYRQ